MPCSVSNCLTGARCWPIDEDERATTQRQAEVSARSECRDPWGRSTSQEDGQADSADMACMRRTSDGRPTDADFSRTKCISRSFLSSSEKA
jgi:hypothetical protein